MANNKRLPRPPTPEQCCAWYGMCDEHHDASSSSEDYYYDYHSKSKGSKSAKAKSSKGWRESESKSSKGWWGATSSSSSKDYYTRWRAGNSQWRWRLRRGLAKNVTSGHLVQQGSASSSRDEIAHHGDETAHHGHGWDGDGHHENDHRSKRGGKAKGSKRAKSDWAKSKRCKSGKKKPSEEVHGPREQCAAWFAPRPTKSAKCEGGKSAKSEAGGGPTPAPPRCEDRAWRFDGDRCTNRSGHGRSSFATLQECCRESFDGSDDAWNGPGAGWNGDGYVRYQAVCPSEDVCTQGPTPAPRPSEGPTDTAKPTVTEIPTAPAVDPTIAPSPRLSDLPSVKSLPIDEPTYSPTETEPTYSPTDTVPTYNPTSLPTAGNDGVAPGEAGVVVVAAGWDGW